MKKNVVNSQIKQKKVELSESAQGVIYDVEPDTNDKEEFVEILPRRTRFYHAVIDANSLKSGTSYKNLKDVVVIMITSYDPFGYDLMVYTIKNCIKELPEVEYDDGAQTIFLNTRGNKGNVSQELKELLRYMECTTEENACNAALQRIHEMVKIVKQDQEVSLEYMKIFEREEMLIEQGRELERKNTEVERARAEKAERYAVEMESENKWLRELLRKQINVS